MNHHEEAMERKYMPTQKVKLGWSDPVIELPAEIAGVRYFNKAKERDKAMGIERRTRELKKELESMGFQMTYTGPGTALEAAQRLSERENGKKGWRVHWNGSKCNHVTGKWAFLARERTVPADVFAEVTEKHRCGSCNAQFKNETV